MMKILTTDIVDIYIHGVFIYNDKCPVYTNLLPTIYELKLLLIHPIHIPQHGHQGVYNIYTHPDTNTETQTNTYTHHTMQTTHVFWNL